MKIFIVEPIEGGSIPIAHYCTKAFHQLGHDVFTFKGSMFLPVFNYIRKLTSGNSDHPLSRLFVQFLANTVQICIEEAAPEVVLGVSQSPLFPWNLSLCRKRRIITVFWFPEDCRRFLAWRQLALQSDYFFIIQKEPILSEVRKLCPRAAYLPLAADPEVHRPVKVDPDKKAYYGSDVSFVGAGYPNRLHAFKFLTNYNLKIWGNGWLSQGATSLRPFVQDNSRRISVEEYVKVFNCSKININLHSSLNPQDIGGDFINPRTFEIAACKAFQLVDRRTLINEIFTNSEMVTFATIEDLRKLIDKFLANDDERKEYAERAYRKVLTYHTYTHRISQILNIVCNDL